jgi:hypothetical protein
MHFDLPWSRIRADHADPEGRVRNPFGRGGLVGSNMGGAATSDSALVLLRLRVLPLQVLFAPAAALAFLSPR